MIVTLGLNVIFTNKLYFFLSLSQAINLNTIRYILNRGKVSFLEVIKLIDQLYIRRGFQIKYVNADNVLST